MKHLDIKVLISEPERKRKYEYVTVNFSLAGLKDYKISTVYGWREPVLDVKKTGDKFYIGLRREIKK